jgi:predicted GTPase
MKRNVIIMGAAGRDFHINSMLFSAIIRIMKLLPLQATQIGIDDKKYPVL